MLTKAEVRMKKASTPCREEVIELCICSNGIAWGVWLLGCLCAQVPTPTRTYSDTQLSEASQRTAHTLSTLMVQGRIVSIIPLSDLSCLVLPECTGNHFLDLDMLWPTAHILLRVNSALSVGMTIPQAKSKVTSPKVSLIWLEGFSNSGFDTRR